MKRHLLITRRRIPLDSKERYVQLWHHVRAAVQHEAGRAWVFRSASTDDYFTEFIEWQRGELLQAAAVASALEALNVAFPAEESGTWTEAEF